MAEARPHNTDTSKYLLNHTMIRVKDPAVTGQWYNKHFGMKLVNKLDFPDMNFALYFLGFDLPQYEGKHWTSRQGLLELTHNYGTENDDNYTVANGNDEPHRGFGHICITLPSIAESCASLEAAGVPFKKRLSEGRMNNIAFALDPNGYWVELVESPPSINTASIARDVKYRLNHTMIRVKDIEKSLEFYRSVMGMSLLRKAEFKEAKFDLYFLAYRDAFAEGLDVDGEDGAWGREGVLELTYNYGTELDSEQKYHTGNTEPKGYGHICVSVDDLDEAVKRFDDLGVKWQKRLEAGSMTDIAFLLDPDGYWIEVIQNEELKQRCFW